MESINLCPPKINTEISSVYSSAPPTNIKSHEEDTYLRNIKGLRNFISILGPGKWIVYGCQESTENGVKFILEGTVIIINKNKDQVDLISVAKQKYSEICYILKEENTESYSIIKRLIFGKSNSIEDNLKWNEFRNIGNISEIIKKNEETDKILKQQENEIKTLKQNQIPKGGIIMWSGNKVPDGYALCDGKNGTPNLVNKFIIGSGGNYSIGNSGGNEKIKIKSKSTSSP